MGDLKQLSSARKKRRFGGTEEKMVKGSKQAAVWDYFQACFGIWGGRCFPAAGFCRCEQEGS